jgi:hypothetical protein
MSDDTKDSPEARTGVSDDAAGTHLTPSSDQQPGRLGPEKQDIDQDVPQPKAEDKAQPKAEAAHDQRHEEGRGSGRR